MTRDPIEARIEAARQDGRQEGYREGVEAAAKWHEARAAEHSRYATREASGQWTNGPALSEDAHRRYAEALRALSPAPAEPSAPVALTRCQAASLRNDGECWHKQCPVPKDITVARLHCTLPGGGDDYVDEDDLPPIVESLSAEAAADNWADVVNANARLATLEAENAALREGLGRIFRITAAGIAALEGRDHG